MQQLELYQSEGCPYCAKVRETLSELGVSYIAHNPRANQERMDELLDLGGQDQIPFLVVRNEQGDVVESMYESDDIVDYLKHEFADA